MATNGLSNLDSKLRSTRTHFTSSLNSSVALSFTSIFGVSEYRHVADLVYTVTYGYVTPNAIVGICIHL